MKANLLAILLFCYFISNCQSSEAIINKMTDDFIAIARRNNVRKIICADYYYAGSYLITETDFNGAKRFSCEYPLSRYVFWERDGHCFVKKFDACGESGYFEVDRHKVFDSPMIYGDTIKAERIKSFEYKFPSDTNLYWESIDHCLGVQLKYYDRTDSVIKDINYFCLSITDNNNHTNLNYTFNNSLKTVLWEKALNEVLVSLYEEKKFKKRN